MGGNVTQKAACDHRATQLRVRSGFLRRKKYQLQCANIHCLHGVGPVYAENPKPLGVFVPLWRGKKKPTARTRRYRKHLKSAYWAKVRLERQKLDGFICRSCGQAGGELEVDHRTYKHLFREAEHLSDLQLCVECHRAKSRKFA